MSFVLEALRDKPRGLWLLDGPTPVDYSGYNQASTVTGTLPTHASLCNGSIFSRVVSDAQPASFTAPVFTQGSEANSFSLEAICRPIVKTTGYVQQPYRENIATNPRAAVGTLGYSGVIGATLTRDTTEYAISPASLKVITPGTSNNEGLSYVQSASSTGTTNGYVSGQVLLKGAGTFVVWIRLIYSDASSQEGPATTAVLSANWTTYLLTETLINSAKTLSSIQVFVRTNGTQAVTFYCGGIQLENTPKAGAYLDGSIPGNEWVGVAHGSVSRARRDVAKANIAINPRVQNNNSPMSNNTSFYSNEWNVTLPVSTPDGITTGYRSVAVSGSGYLTSTYNVDGWGGLPLYRYIGAWVMTPQSGYEVRQTIGGVQSFVPLTANQWKWVNEETPTYAGIAIRKVSGGNATVGDAAYITGIVSSFDGPPTSFFDGATVGAEWTGTPYLSASTMRPSDTEQQILGNLGKMDGLTIEGTTVSFVTKYTTSGEARASYDLQELRNVHLMGVHSSQKNSLYVNGALVSEVDIAAYQQAEKFTTTSPALYSGNTYSSRRLALQAVGTYNYAVPSESVARHAYRARDAVDSASVPIQFGGEEISLLPILSNVSFSMTYDTRDEWDDGTLNNCSIIGDRLQQKSSDGMMQDGDWKNVFPLYLAGSTINSVTMNWSGKGAEVSASLDGITWVEVVQGQNLSFITSNFSTANKLINISVTFPENDYGKPYYLDSLTVNAYASAAAVRGSRTITQLGSPVYGKDYEPIELRDDWGVTLDPSDALLISTADDGTNNPAVLEMWVRNIGTANGTFLMDARNSEASTHGYIWRSGAGTFQSGGTVYINGVAQSSQWSMPENEWVLLHYVPTAVTPTVIHINERYTSGSKGNFQIGQVVFYASVLTATQISQIYQSYLGRPIARATDTSALVVTEPVNSATIYTHDWSIQSAG